MKAPDITVQEKGKKNQRTDTMQYPKRVTVADITVRDGLQHEETLIPTEAKLWIAKELIKAGFKKIEVTNYGNPKRMPQFADADQLFEQLFKSKSIAERIKDVELTAITIRERAVDRAIEAHQKGYGPNRVLMMVSTSEPHQKVNSGVTIEEYFKEAEVCIRKAHDAGIKVNGTVSTIWGCPIAGPTDMKVALDFTKRWLDIGADDVEHADHDGSASPDRVYRYFSMLLDAIPDPEKHVAHFHSTRGWGMANVLAALQTGVTRFESTMGGIGGQPANFVNGIPVKGTGDYYYRDPSLTGLVPTEDLLVMFNEMGIETGVDIDRVLEIGAMVEKIIGRKLRAETVSSGRISKAKHGYKIMNR